MAMMSRRWKIKDYVHTGNCWIRYGKNHDSYIYINIPKNASSWMMSAFVGMGGFSYNFITKQMQDPIFEYQQSDHNYPVPRYIILLRDPISRWLSGAAQAFFAVAPDSPYFFMNYTDKKIFDQIVFDEHTAPQTLFLKHVDLSQAIYFDCTPDLTTCFFNWAQDKFDEDLKTKNSDNNSFNISSNGTGKIFQSFTGDGEVAGWSQQQIINELQSRLDANPQYVQQLKEFYANDYKLRESVTFYAPR